MEDKNKTLDTILKTFIESGWDLIAEPSKAYLNGGDKKSLLAAVRQADCECGSCGCELDPLYKEAIAILAASNKITSYRRIQNWENFFVDSAIYSVGQSLGVTFDSGYAPISAVTGDMFTYLYSTKAPSDSGLTCYVYLPEMAKKSFELFGCECEYLSNADIKADFEGAMNKIRASIDNGVPVMAWGMGGVVMNDGSRWNPLSEGAVIGGYDEDNLLYVNLYPGAERLADVSADGKPGVDEYGYTAIRGGLDTTYGIFIAGEKTAAPDMKKIYRETIEAIPHWLTLAPTEEHVFGKIAFYDWAEVLRNDIYWDSPDKANGNNWDLHATAYCTPCTSLDSAVGYLKQSAVELPDYTVINTIIPLYEKLRDYKDEIWSYQGGFMTSTENIMKHDFREHIAGILCKMGDTCDEICAAFTE